MKKFLLCLTVFFITSLFFAEEINFSADSMEGVAGNKDNITILNGNAFIKTSTMEIKADSIELSGKDFRYIIASGNIACKNTESAMEFTCGKMKYDRITKIIGLSEKVHLEDVSNKVIAEAEIIEYNQNTDVAIMQININLKQKDNVCSGAYAIYRKNAQLLEINGNAEVAQGKDKFGAHSITLNLNTQEIELNGGVHGNVVDSKTVNKDEKVNE